MPTTRTEATTRGGRGGCAPADRSPSDAVDHTLIDAMAELTPEQRLMHNDRVIRTIVDLRAALSNQRDPAD